MRRPKTSRWKAAVLFLITFEYSIKYVLEAFCPMWWYLLSFRVMNSRWFLLFVRPTTLRTSGLNKMIRTLLN